MPTHLTNRPRRPSNGHGKQDTKTRAPRSKRGLSGRRPSPAAWQRLRAGLAKRALADGLVDVTFERHDTPLGRDRPRCDRAKGLVRVGLPCEDEDAVLAELAARVSPRVLAAPREPLRRARLQLDEYFAGRRQSFDVALDWRLTAGFRREVLRATARDPVRPHGVVPRGGGARRQPGRVPRHRQRARDQPAADRRAVPPRAAVGRRHRPVPRRQRGEGAPAAPRGRAVSTPRVACARARPGAIADVAASSRSAASRTASPRSSTRRAVAVVAELARGRRVRRDRRHSTSATTSSAAAS